MTTSADNRSENYPGAGSTGPFTYNFPVSATDEIVVTKYDSSNVPTVLALVASSPSTGEYTNTLTSGGASGGSVTLGVALAVGESLNIQGSTPKSQAVPFTNQGAFFAEKHEDAYDKLTRIAQETNRDATRSLRYSPLDDDNSIDSVLPPLTADAVIKANSAGDGFEMGPTAANITNAETYANNAETAKDDAETAQAAAEDAQSYAEEWAIKAEDSPVSVAAGGDASTTFSALHWAAKAEDFAAGVNLPALGSANTLLQVNTGGTALEYGLVDTVNIADDAVTVAKIDRTVNAIGSIGGGTQDIDLDSGRTVTGTVDTSTTTFTFSNPLSGSDAFDLYLTNGGSQTVNWPASVDWDGGTPPTLTASGVDHLVFTTPDGGTTWYGYVAGLDMS